MKPFSWRSKMMRFKIVLQYLVPQHLLSRLMGILGECRWDFFKNWAIKKFIRDYHVDLTLAQLEHVEDYPNFNLFFTRRLKPELRPIVDGANQIASPVDGSISQIGKIEKGSLFQAKGFYFNLNTLLGNLENQAKLFYDGHYATLYLAPKDYHRVHMPIAGKLRETLYIPGKLFSVNHQTTEAIPDLFSRNERLICLFDTAHGPMAVILVGALFVGSIKTVFPLEYASNKSVIKHDEKGIQLDRGAELGFFQMGSTVIILFPSQTIDWSENLRPHSTLKMGQLIGTLRDLKT